MTQLKVGRLYTNSFLANQSDTTMINLGFMIFTDKNKSNHVRLEVGDFIMIIEVINQSSTKSIRSQKFTNYKVLTKDIIGYINIYEGAENDWQEICFG